MILVVSLLFNAPLEEPVNVMHPPNPAKAPWYFLGLQEMVSYSAFWGGIGIPTIFVILLLLAPYLDRAPGGVGKWFARERLLANTLFLTFVDRQRDLHHHRHVLPRPELGVRHPLVRRTPMRLALAIASFVILVVHGVVFYNQFFHKWERYQTAYFDQARGAGQDRRRTRRASTGRSPRIEQIIVTSFGETRVDRCTTCHIAIDDPRFDKHAQPAEDAPLLGRDGRRA